MCIKLILVVDKVKVCKWFIENWIEHISKEENIAENLALSKYLTFAKKNDDTGEVNLQCFLFFNKFFCSWIFGTGIT